MDVIGVFSSWVTALRKLSCCSFRRTSRTRKIVFRMTPAMMKPKKMTPRMSGTISRQFRMIQLVLSTVAAAAMHTPSVTKNAILVVRLMGRIGCGQNSRIPVKQGWINRPRYLSSRAQPRELRSPCDTILAPQPLGGLHTLSRPLRIAQLTIGVAHESQRPHSHLRVRRIRRDDLVPLNGLRKMALLLL